MKNWSFVTESKNFVPLIVIGLSAQTELMHSATVRARVGAPRRRVMASALEIGGRLVRNKEGKTEGRECLNRTIGSVEESLFVPP